jgi:GTPase SAR1 family protein
VHLIDTGLPWRRPLPRHLSLTNASSAPSPVRPHSLIHFPLRSSCALHGNPGVGKSQLTYSWSKSAFSHKESAYIRYSCGKKAVSRVLLTASHRQSSRLIAPQGSMSGAFVVFDNVFPETLDLLRQHLPRANGQVTIPFTTRTRDVAIAFKALWGNGTR